MISRAASFFTPSAGAFTILLLGSMQILEARECFAQPPKEVEFSIEPYQAEEESYEAEWAQYLEQMKEAFNQVQGLELPPPRKVEVWTRFLQAYEQNDPFSQEDEELRDKARERIVYWQEKAGEPLETENAATIRDTPDNRELPVMGAEGSGGQPAACLVHLDSARQSSLSGGLRLGRIFRDEKITEPVLIRTIAGGYSYRRCANGRPTETVATEDELEIFNSALVARFVQEKTETLTTYREVQSLGYEPEGEAELAFRGPGSMLEARRLDNDHVEVTIFPQVRVTILLIASHTAMASIDPRVWEESWGDLPADSHIEREIVWWELTDPEVGSADLRIHPTVGSFHGLADLLTDEEAVAAPNSWNSILEGDELKDMLSSADFSLFVVEQPEHIEWAVAMRQLATKMSSDVELDIGTVEVGWGKDNRKRLEDAASWGRYWPLVRHGDLAAIMPDRIAGKIRRNYRESNPVSTEDTDFTKAYVTLKKDPRKFSVANAIYQDQAAVMANTMGFLGCLLENNSVASSRLEVLEQGLRQMNVPAERLDGMDVRKAFQYLFQGMSLPSPLRAGDRSFLGGVSRGDPEVLSLVRALQSYFDTTSFDPGPSCDVALIPDSVLLGPPFYEPLLVVPGVPKSETFSATEIDISEKEEHTRQKYKEAVLAKKEARKALKEAIFAKAARHTKRKIEDGHQLLDKGDKLLNNSNGIGSRVRKAIARYEDARKIFVKAKETADRIEYESTKLKVH